MTRSESDVYTAVNLLVTYQQGISPKSRVFSSSFLYLVELPCIWFPSAIHSSISFWAQVAQVLRAGVWYNSTKLVFCVLHSVSGKCCEKTEVALTRTITQKPVKLLYTNFLVTDTCVRDLILA
jgi:hypothetical protein